MKGDLGQSISTGLPVTHEILNRLPASAELTLFAFVLAVIIANSARRYGSSEARLFRGPCLPDNQHAWCIASDLRDRASAHLPFLLPVRFGTGAHWAN